MQEIFSTNRLTIRENLNFFNELGEKREINLCSFAKYTLGYEKIGEEHEVWQERLLDAVNIHGLHKLLFLKPRGTFKTTFYTVTLPLWLHLDNPNLRILIANAVSDNAEKFLAEITGHYLRNERLAWLYKQVRNEPIPVDPRKSLTTSLRLTNCTKIQKEPNIVTTGFGSSIVSSHYDVIIVDDLVDRNDRQSPTVREAKKKWFSDLASLLEPNGLLLIVGTRWSADDVYGYIINELNPKHAAQDKYHVEIESCYTMKDGKRTATFPRILSLEKLEELKIDKTHYEFLANYENSPISSEFALFKLDAMTFYDPQELSTMQNLIYYGFADPALGKNSQSDLSAFITIAVDRNGIIYVVGAEIGVMILSAFKERIFQQAQRYRYSKLGVENNGFQDLFLQSLQLESTRNHLYAAIEGIRHSSNKIGRIQSLEPLIRAADNRPAIVRFRRDWHTAYPELIEELIQFPASKHDDAVDALESVISLARAGYSELNCVFLVGVQSGIYSRGG
jgi:predicted phage terminase large subunit-like protein